jgi:hypothetical protein
VSGGTVGAVREAFQLSPGKSTRRASNILKCSKKKLFELHFEIYIYIYIYICIPRTAIFL